MSGFCFPELTRETRSETAATSSETRPRAFASESAFLLYVIEVITAGARIIGEQCSCLASKKRGPSSRRAACRRHFALVRALGRSPEARTVARDEVAVPVLSNPIEVGTSPLRTRSDHEITKCLAPRDPRRLLAFRSVHDASRGLVDQLRELDRAVAV